MDSIVFGLLNKLNKKIDAIESIPDEKITEAVNTYLDENPVTPGATNEQAKQIQDNTNNIAELKSDLALKVPNTDYAPEEKNDAMTQPVGKDANGKLWTAPVSGGNVNLTGYATEQFVRDNYQPKGNYLESSELPTAINTALSQAKESGEFNGVDGYTPIKGTDYYTDADKTEIVNLVLDALPSAEGVSY